MTNKKFRKKLMVSLAVMLLAGSLTACKKADSTTDNTAAQVTEVTANDVSYIKTYFDITFANETVTAEEFNAALANLGSESKVEGELTYLSAVKAAMSAANFEELVLSYPQDKTNESLKNHGIKDTVDESYAAYLACAIDTGLLNEAEGKEAAKNAAVTKTQAESLVLKIANANGEARNYLGYSNDADIYAKVDQTWNSFILFDDAALAEIGRTAVQNKVVTGYNVKNEAYNANFLPELTLQYGHSDIKHAHQLLGLLNSEGITAKVQLEPKVSIYEYLLDWGPVPESTPTYAVKQFSDDMYLCYAVEYDMQLEFNNKEDMLRFNEVINEYAKKWEGNEDAVGLIYASWWQPLYSTTVMDMPSDSYFEIGDCYIENGMYSLHTFYLPKDKDTVISSLQSLAGDLEVKSHEKMVNKAFYNYLTGDDYQ